MNSSHTIRIHSDLPLISNAHYINGQRVSSDTTFELFSPIDQSHLAVMCEANAATVAHAVSSALAAYPAWSKLGAQGRLPYLLRFAEEIGKRKALLCLTESTDAGVLQSRMEHGVVPRCMLNITYFAQAALTLQDKTIETEQATHLIQHDSAGVCAIITPWNAPLMLTTWKLGPALASGNTVVVKPPEGRL